MKSSAEETHNLWDRRVPPGWTWASCSGSWSHLEQAVNLMVAPGTRVRTNGLRGFLSLGDKGFVHERVFAKGTAAPVELRWFEVVVSNARAMIGGTYHGLGRADDKHLQFYLDEYGYRFSRRNRPDLIFTSCITAVTDCPIWTYWDIIGRRPVRPKPKLQAV